MTKLDYRNVEKAADRCGGKAVVVGTRLRVVTVLSIVRVVSVRLAREALRTILRSAGTLGL